MAESLSRRCSCRSSHFRLNNPFRSISLRIALLIALFFLTAGAAFAAGKRDDAKADSLMWESFRRLECRADSGDAASIYSLALVRETGYGPIKADTALAVSLFEKAAEKGYAPALNYYGFKLFNGEGIAADRTRGLDMIEKAAMKGDVKGEANLGWLLAEGEGVEHDPEKAVYWLGKAARSGLPIAMLQLGDIYARGMPPVRPDTLLADSLFSAAAKAGVAEADIRLAMLMKERWQQLDADSALNLGVEYFTTGEAPYSGVDLFRIAAEKGNARAWALLGEAMALGRGAVYDHSRSVKAFYRAARMGNASAQFIIAEMLDMFPDALSDILDSDENRWQQADVNAASWYEKASRQGVNNSREAMERLYSPQP